MGLTEWHMFVKKQIVVAVAVVAVAATSCCSPPPHSVGSPVGGLSHKGHPTPPRSHGSHGCSVELTVLATAACAARVYADGQLHIREILERESEHDTVVVHIFTACAVVAGEDTEAGNPTR